MSNKVDSNVTNRVSSLFDRVYPDRQMQIDRMSKSLGTINDHQFEFCLELLTEIVVCNSKSYDRSNPNAIALSFETFTSRTIHRN